jgi:hypothetical protein
VNHRSADPKRSASESGEEQTPRNCGSLQTSSRVSLSHPASNLSDQPQKPLGSGFPATSTQLTCNSGFRHPPRPDRTGTAASATFPTEPPHHGRLNERQPLGRLLSTRPPTAMPTSSPAGRLSSLTYSAGTSHPSPPKIWSTTHDAFVRDKAGDGEDAESIRIMFEVEFPGVKATKAWIQSRMRA